MLSLLQLLLLLLNLCVVPIFLFSAAARSSCNASWRVLRALLMRYCVAISDNAKSAWRSLSISTKAYVLFFGTITETPRSPPYLRKARSSSARRRSTSGSVWIFGSLLMKSFLCAGSRNDITMWCQQTSFCCLSSHKPAN